MPAKKYATEEERIKSKVEYKRKWKESNKEKCLSYNRNYRKGNAIKIKEKENSIFRKEQKKKWNQNNKQKTKIYSKRWRESNKEKASQLSKQWRELNKGKVYELQKKWGIGNKNKLKLSAEKFRNTNREKIRSRQKVNYEINKEEILKKQRLYFKQNPLSSKLSKIRRRESLKSLGEKSLVNKNFIHTVTLKFNNRCFRCNSDKDLCIDHHYPLYLGNPLTISNAVLLCRSCNSSKSIKLPESFYSPEQLTDLQLNYGISKSPVKEEQPSLFEARMPKNLERENDKVQAMNAA